MRLARAVRPVWESMPVRSRFRYAELLDAVQGAGFATDRTEQYNVLYWVWGFARRHVRVLECLLLLVIRLRVRRRDTSGSSRPTGMCSPGERKTPKPRARLALPASSALSVGREMLPRAVSPGRACLATHRTGSGIPSSPAAHPCRASSIRGRERREPEHRHGEVVDNPMAGLEVGCRDGGSRESLQEEGEWRRAHITQAPNTYHARMKADPPDRHGDERHDETESGSHEPGAHQEQDRNEAPGARWGACILRRASAH
jgi:hypothetical protein